jgi:phosphoglucosamine mutase
MTNYGLELALKERRIKLLRAAVGDRYVVEEMRRSRARLGGEPSGHIISFRHSTTGDGMLTALLLLKLGARFGGWTRLPQLIVNVRVREKAPLDGIAPVADAISQVGRALEGRGRLVVRYSGTEPLCRIMVEGPDADELQRLARQIGEPLEQHLGDQTVRQH